MHFIFQFGEFSDEGGTDWISAIVSLLSAFIGAGVALLVYRNSIHDQKTKDAEQKDSFELTKLKYLHFLMLDTFRSIKILLDAFESFTAQLASNPLETPTIQYNPTISLSRIANRINQEEFYHASINQLHNDSISEIFLMFDNLDEQIKDSIDYYTEHRQRIHDTRSKVGPSYSILNEATIDFLGRIDQLDFKSHNDEIKRAIIAILSKVEYEGNKGSAIGPFYYVPLHEIFPIPLVNLLLPYKSLPEVDKIIKLAHILDANFTSVLNYNRVMAEEMLNFRDRINQTTVRLDVVAGPLKEFVKTHLSNSGHN